MAQQTRIRWSSLDLPQRLIRALQGTDSLDGSSGTRVRKALYSEARDYQCRLHACVMEPPCPWPGPCGSCPVRIDHPDRVVSDGTVLDGVIELPPGSIRGEQLVGTSDPPKGGRLGPLKGALAAPPLGPHTDIDVGIDPDATTSTQEGGTTCQDANTRDAASGE